MSNLAEEQQLKEETGSSKRFLELFKRVKVEFFQTTKSNKDDKPIAAKCTLYQPTIWSKSRSANGSSFDCLQIERDFPPNNESDKDKELEFIVKISLWIDSTPERF